MEGSNAEEALKATMIFVKSLPEGQKFNIVKFGSDYKKMWVSPASLNEDNHDEVIAYVNSIKSDMGGTELENVLKDIMLQPVKTFRNIVLITDGEVHNAKSLIDTVSKYPQNRFFTIGLGKSASKALVDGLASANSGFAEYVYDSEVLPEVVVRQLERSFCTTVEPILICNGEPIKKLHPMISCERKRFYVMGLPDASTFGVSYTSKSDTVILHSKPQTKILYLSPGPILCLAARDEIEALEKAKVFAVPKEIEELDKRILELSLKYGVLCDLTAFVAVEMRTTPGGEMELVDINSGMSNKRSVMETGNDFRLQPMAVGASQSRKSKKFDVMEECCAYLPETCYVVEQHCLRVEPKYKSDMDAIVQTQKPNGLWAFSEDLFEELFDDELEDSFGNVDISKKDEYFITVCVMTYLCVKLMNKKPTWNLMYKKALAALEKGWVTPNPLIIELLRNQSITFDTIKSFV
jgi:hypothetical protein